MAVAFQTATTATTASHSGSLSVNPPASLASGDLWMIFVFFDNDAAGTETVNLPAGWSGVTTTQHGNANYPAARTIYKTAGASESAVTVTFSTSQAYGAGAVSLRFDGQNATPIDTSGTANPAGTAATLDMSDITVANNDSMAVLVAVQSASASQTFTAVSGTAEAADVNVHKGDWWGVTADYLARNSGSYAPGNLTSTQNAVGGTWVGQTISIAPAAGGGGGTAGNLLTLLGVG